MAKCSYCGSSAGWFSAEHPGCRERVEGGLAAVRRVFAGYLTRDPEAAGVIGALRRELAHLTAAARLPNEQVREELAQEWASTVREVVDAALPSRGRVHQLRTFATAFSLTTDSAHARDADSRLERAFVLRRCVEGDLPEWRGPSPFTLRRREQLVWMLNDVRYFEDRAPRVTDRRSGSIPAALATYGGEPSADAARGIYLGAAAFGSTSKSWALNDPVSAYVDAGTLGLTTSHIHFHSPRHSVRVAYGELADLSPYRNALVVARTAAGTLPQALAVNAAADAWFVYNLAANLARRAGNEIDDPSGEVQGERSVA
ncbi:MAG TPA: hypothetical protein VKA84_02740 [Gemmatimonadaceae bacterium]|nr:hypothetical protein [Gemmatimonadaceae bacterium]